MNGEAQVAAERARLIRQVNRLYHELGHAAFDGDHRYRHRIERGFWLQVARRVLDGGAARAGAGGEAARSRSRVILDLACGTGFVATVLKDSLRAADRVIAVDLGEEPLHETARKWHALTPGAMSNATPAELNCVLADGEALPLAEASADLVTMNASLHHFPDPLRALGAVDRVLRPGGYFALGFEPNRVHFASTALRRMSDGLNRIYWYTSPTQTWRRVRERLVHDRADAAGWMHDGSDVLATAINERLMRDELIAEAMSVSRVLDLVDPHARGAGRQAGFDATALLHQAMPAYEVVLLSSCDYLGEAARRWPAVRTVADAALRALLPRHGSLFCWLVRKPANSAEAA